MIQCEHVKKEYGRKTALADFSAEFETGKIIGLLGPNGSGKTTLLRMIAGLEMPNSGDIYIDGKRVNDIPASKRGIGFVFQNYALFRYMTVYDNIAFGLKVQKVDKKTIDKRVKELIELIGLKGLDKRYPSQLSGGQRQRVAIARALSTKPELIVADEPIASLDVSIQAQMVNLFRKLQKEQGFSFLFIAHDLSMVEFLCDRTGVMYHGKLVEEGRTKDIFAHPEHEYTKALLAAVPIPDPRIERQKGEVL